MVSRMSFPPGGEGGGSGRGGVVGSRWREGTRAVGWLFVVLFDPRLVGCGRRGSRRGGNWSPSLLSWFALEVRRVYLHRDIVFVERISPWRGEVP